MSPSPPASPDRRAKKGNEMTMDNDTTQAGALAEINAERAAQDKRWGGAVHDDTHGPHDWFGYIEKQTGRGSDELGRHPESELSISFARERLIIIAALAIAGVESIDRKAAINPHRPVEGVTLWNSSDCAADREGIGAEIYVDGKIAGFIGDNGVVYRLTTSRNATPRRVHNPAHTVEILTAFRDKVRAERMAASSPPLEMRTDSDRLDRIIELLEESSGRGTQGQAKEEGWSYDDRNNQLGRH